MVITDYAALHIKLNNYNHRRLNGFTRASNRPLNVAYLAYVGKNIMVVADMF